jgi:hypothetical protein
MTVCDPRLHFANTVVDAKRLDNHQNQ